jgi:hypothetical protein
MCRCVYIVEGIQLDDALNLKHVFVFVHAKSVNELPAQADEALSPIPKDSSSP